jgi:hypothetical protein
MEVMERLKGRVPNNPFWVGAQRDCRMQNGYITVKG